MKTIYLDNNSTTPLLPQVWERMQPFWFDISGNPASSHSYGRRARQALETAREITANVLGASPDGVIFTSGATEANNLALFGLASSPPGHVLISPIEHPCVTEPADRLAQSGFEVDVLQVNAVGMVDPKSFQQQVQETTRLVSVMLANHETGTIQPISELVQMCPPSSYFHCDAAAAAGKFPFRFSDLGVTSMTISAHKFHGPKGVGALIVRRDAKLTPLLLGGHQQQSKRPGTEPVALAVGLAAALEMAVEEMTERQDKVTRLRERFLEILRDKATPIIVNGPATGGVPHTLNVSFPGCQSDLLLMNFDLVGIACSTGSACSSGSLLPSPVIEALQVTEDVLRSAMRFSFSHLLSLQDIEEAANRIGEVVSRMRNELTD
ncbi:MAG: cysteine desulfurase family protein [Gemmataceae bacterium]